MKDDAQHQLVEPFEADDNSLLGIRPYYAFALGVEWAMFRQKLLDEKPFTALCLPENRARFVRLAETNGRFVEDRPIAGSDWVEVWVGDVISCGSR